MRTGDELNRQDYLANKSANPSDEQSLTLKAWSDFYHADNIVDFYLEKSGYQINNIHAVSGWKTLKNQQMPSDDSLAVKTWLNWYESGDDSHSSKPVVFKSFGHSSDVTSEISAKKEKVQAKEIKTRVGVGKEESLALRTWLNWYESGDSPNLQKGKSAKKQESPRPDIQAKEIKTRTGIGDEESLAVRTWLEWYESGDDPANIREAKRKADPRPDIREKEIKTRTGIGAEEAKAVLAWSDLYNADDFLDAYLEKSGF